MYPSKHHERRLDDELPMLLMPQSGIFRMRPHTHPEGQLYFALRGLIVIEAAGERSVLPAGRVGWIPPHTPHSVNVYGRLPGGLVGYTMHLAPSLCAGMPALSVVRCMTALLDNLLQRMSLWPGGFPPDAAGRRLMQVFLDELNATEADPLHLTMPRHPRLLDMAAAIAQDPADETSLDTWATKLGLSRRSITRHFRSETGMSLIEWRQIARLQRGMELLTAGESVTTVAMTLGYDSVSSFIALFRRLLGTTPAKFAA